MKIAFLSIVLLNLNRNALAQNIQIQAQPPHVNYLENNLVILCSITNPTQLSQVFYIEFQKNSSVAFNTVVSVASQVTWPTGSTLQNRASATGSVETPSSAQLRLTIDKGSVQCPTDFTTYRCGFSGLTAASKPVTQESNPITITYTIKPTHIAIPKVTILGQPCETTQRTFPVATTLQLMCEGQVGNDESRTIRWCTKKASDFSFTGLPQIPIYSETSPSGCQYIRSSTITYNLTSTDTFTQFLCESGDEGLCGTGSAKQYVNISIECEDGFYDISCNTKCGQCTNGEPCDKQTGLCSSGCQPYFQPPLCLECAPGFYGYNCDKTCKYCNRSSPSCRKSDGHCLYGFDENKFLTEIMSKTNTDIGLYVVIGILVILLTAAVSVNIYQRRRISALRHKITNDQRQTHAHMNLQNYDNLTVNDENHLYSTLDAKNENSHYQEMS